MANIALVASRDQIESVGQRGAFVEIVDSPNQAALKVTPGAKILDVKIAYGENPGSLGRVGADLGPDLHPAIKGSAEKRKWRLRHVLVFQAKIRFYQRSCGGRATLQSDELP